MRNKLIVVGAVFLALGLCPPVAHGQTDAAYVGCGLLGPPWVCAGVSIYNNATCICPVALYCQADGWHLPTYEPDSYQPDEDGNRIYVAEMACAYRARCVPVDGDDESDPCGRPQPGCHFLADWTAVPHPVMRDVMYYEVWYCSG